MHPKAKGERSEACVLAALLKQGYVVLMPFGDNQRYDMVIESGGCFMRVQCKTGRLRDGIIAFQPGSRAGGQGRRRGYQGEIECFGVYCPDNDTVYIVPIGDCPGRNLMHLRVDQPKNGVCISTMHWARDYELTEHFNVSSGK